MLLCPAPATTMSKRSAWDACWPMENGVTASGASAAVFTNPRRLILLMGTPPRNNLLGFLLYDFLDAGSEIFQHDRRCVSPRPARYGTAWLRRGHCLMHPLARYS